MSFQLAEVAAGCVCMLNDSGVRTTYLSFDFSYLDANLAIHKTMIRKSHRIKAYPSYQVRTKTCCSSSTHPNRYGCSRQ